MFITGAGTVENEEPDSTADGNESKPVPVDDAKIEAEVKSGERFLLWFFYRGL